MRRVILSMLAGLLLVVLVFGPARPARAAAIVVNSNLDGAPANDTFCTLREAIMNANANNQSGSTDCAAGAGADLISFAADYTITLDAAQFVFPVVTSPITISGNGQANTIIQASACDPTAGACAHNVHLFVYGTAGDFTLNNLTLRHGRCIDPGCDGDGSLILGLNGGTLLLDNATLARSEGNDLGAGLSVRNSSVTIRNSLIEDNIGGFFGTGIYAETSSVTIDNSVVRNNRTMLPASMGAGIFATGGTLIVRNSLMSGNRSQDGGGIAGRGSASVTIDASTITGNTASSSGGGVYAENLVTLTIQNNSVIENNSADNYGGGVLVRFASVTIDASQVRSNRINVAGGGWGAGVALISANGTIRNGTVIGGAGTGNISANAGGGLYLRDNSTLTIDASEVSGNIANGPNLAWVGGGGIFSESSTAIIQNGSVIGRSGAPNQTPNAVGGGIYSLAGNLTINDSIVSYNTASVGAGMIADLAIVNVHNAIFFSNSASGGVGGIGVSSNTVLNMTDSIISGNSDPSSTGGGIVANAPATVNVANSCITGNSSPAVNFRFAGVTHNLANNWWGAADGPGAPGGPGSGDTIGTLVTNFSPWLTSTAGTPCVPAVPAPALVSPTSAPAPACPPLDLEATALSAITPGGEADVLFTVRNPNAEGSCASDLLEIEVPGGLNVRSVHTTQGQVLSEIPPTLAVALGSIAPGSEVRVTVRVSLPQTSARLSGLARAALQSGPWCLRGRVPGDTATACLNLNNFPSQLPETGGRPAESRPWAWIIAGIVTGGLIGGMALRRARRTH